MYPVITAQEAFAQGSKPWLLYHIASKYGRSPIARKLRDTARELAALWAAAR